MLDLKSSYIVISVFRGFIKDQAQGKLTSCERDLAVTLVLDSIPDQGHCVIFFCKDITLYSAAFLSPLCTCDAYQQILCRARETAPHQGRSSTISSHFSV